MHGIAKIQTEPVCGRKSSLQLTLLSKTGEKKEKILRVLRETFQLDKFPKMSLYGIVTTHVGRGNTQLRR